MLLIKIRHLLRSTGRHGWCVLLLAVSCCKGGVSKFFTLTPVLFLVVDRCFMPEEHCMLLGVISAPISLIERFVSGSGYYIWIRSSGGAISMACLGRSVVCILGKG